MKLLRPHFFALAILGFITLENSVVMSELLEHKTDNEDTKLTVIQLINKYGYSGETHTVNTEDGYILGMHRITGPKSNPNPEGKQPVLVVHPLVSSSADFIITGPGRALGYVLADEGYDVWLANVRGNKFSRSHKKHTSLDKEYWQFSWHESGIYDLPAMIDYILKKTNRQQLLYVGHSQGTTAFWVMTSERPEYQEKVKAIVALAPIAYLTNIRNSLYHILGKFSNQLDFLASALSAYEIDPDSKILKLMKSFCDGESWGQSFCMKAFHFISGPGSDQLNITTFRTILAHIPAGGSFRQVIHYLQLIKADKFQQYDHGLIGNLLKYKQFNPPVYDLSIIKVPAYLHYSTNDWLAVPLDIERLYKELGNPIGMYRVPHEEFTHFDFIWAKDSKELLYNKIISQLRLHED